MTILGTVMDEKVRIELDAPFPITQEHISFYKEYGYLKLSQVLSPKLLEHYRRAIAAQVAKLFTGMLSIPSWSELPQMPGCLRSAEFEPTVVSNPEARVTFRCRNATSLDLIRAVGRQTRIPIGVVIGKDPAALLTIQHSYDLDRVNAKEALSKAIDGTGYSPKKEGPVFVLIAGDLALRQRKILTHQYDDFPSGTQSMTSLAAMLTMWMRAASNPAVGYGGSILGSTNDEQISVHAKHAATTEQIANQIVSQGSRGLRVFKVDASTPFGTSSDEIDTERYQHYSNGPM